MHLSLAFTLAFLVFSCDAHNFRLGGCPKVKVMKDFDVSRFVGDWYVVQRFNPMTTCVKVNIEKSSDGSYTVNETSRPFGMDFGFIGFRRKARKMSFISNETDAIFKVDRNFKYVLTTYGIIDTDYDSYAIVWACDPLLVSSVQNLDILSRLPENNAELAKQARHKVEDYNIDLRTLEKVDQTKCGNIDGTDLDGDRTYSNMFV